MNLKESFRYQNFLGALMQSACGSIQNRDHAMTTKKIHRRNKVNADDEDIEEIVDVGAFTPNDTVVKFIEWLINEKCKLTSAISAAKATLSFDLDTAIEANKFRQTANSALRHMLMCTASKQTTQGRGYKFDANNEQKPYYYEIDIVSEEAYSRAEAKAFMKGIIEEADRVSSEIDAAMINTKVDYTPVYDVNESFDDIMIEFSKTLKSAE